jgi:hypothetical protein
MNDKILATVEIVRDSRGVSAKVVAHAITREHMIEALRRLANELEGSMR